MTIVDGVKGNQTSLDLKYKKNDISHKQRGMLSSKVILDILRVIDFFIVFSTSLLVKYIYIDTYLGVTDPTYSYKYLFPAFLCAVLSYVLFRRARLYRDFVFNGFQMQLGNVFYSLVTAFSILLFFSFMFKVTEQYSRVWFVSWFAVAIVLVFIERLIVRNILRMCVARGMFKQKIAIVAGDHEAGGELENSLLAANLGIEIVGCFDDSMTEEMNGWGTMDKLIELGQDNHIDQVFIAMPTSEEARLNSIFNRLRILPVDIQISPTRQSSQLPLLKVQKLGGTKLLLVHRKPIEGWSYIFKAIMDYLFASIALVLFFPAMILIALFIKLDSPGPIFFLQRRHGYNHQPIRVLKFRTMTVMEDGDKVQQAQKEDKRVTKVGKFLRKTSLDELPQLINVLKGEMSLVGPRPHAMAHNHYYSEMIEKYANRHRVKPGITGWAQVNGHRGPTNKPEDMKKRAELDLHYIDNWSIWLDMKIIVMTPFYGFVGKNAF